MAICGGTGTDDIGRLGYACLNTVLRSTKPHSIFCSRTCRIASIEEEGMELPKGLGMLNVKDLKVMIEVGPVSTHFTLSVLMIVERAEQVSKVAL